MSWHELVMTLSPVGPCVRPGLTASFNLLLGDIVTRRGTTFVASAILSQSAPVTNPGSFSTASLRFSHSDEQEKVADEVIAELNAEKLWDDPIVTEVVPAESFYPAEDYHQEYFRRNPNQGYCRMVIAPKVAKFRKEYLARLKRVG